jgi:hypothetical protein
MNVKLVDDKALADIRKFFVLQFPPFPSTLSFSPNAHPMLCFYDFQLCLLRDVINYLMHWLVK